MQNAIYGGRVDNTFDMKVLTSYLLQFFDSSLFGSSSRGKRLGPNINLPQSTNIKVRHCSRFKEVLLRYFSRIILLFDFFLCLAVFVTKKLSSINSVQVTQRWIEIGQYLF